MSAWPSTTKVVGSSPSLTGCTIFETKLWDNYNNNLSIVIHVIIIVLSWSLFALQLLEQKNYEIEGTCLHLFHYHLFHYSASKHSKSSAMMTVIGEVGSWKDMEVALEKEMVYGMARFGRDTKVGCEWARSQNSDCSPLWAHVEPPTESHIWLEIVP